MYREWKRTTSQIKDKKISILKRQRGTDKRGFPIDEWEYIPNGQNLWAYYRQASSREFYEAAQLNHKVEVIFKINWRDDLEHDMKVEFRGKKYGITRIDDFEGYKQDLTIYAYAIE